MIIQIKKTASDLKIKSADLITRPVGRRVFAEVEKKLDVISIEETVVLDFEGIRVIDSSFIDEFIIKLYKLASDSSRIFYIKLKNISNITEINIDLVIKSYSNYKKERLVIITDDIRSNNSFYIGELSDFEKMIIEYLRRNRSASLEEISDHTETGSDKVLQTLRGLFSLRAVKLRENYCEGV
jgi:hypothetical protein